MTRVVEGEERSQNVLFPERLEDWISEDNPVRVVDAFVDELDLQTAGYSVRTAADGKAGLAAVKLAAPALVVTGIHMPEMTGTMVIAELERRYPEMPVVAMSCLFNTGHAMDANAPIALSGSIL